MALHLLYQTEPGGFYTVFDIASNNASGFKLTVSDEHPMQLRFSVKTSQEQMPIGFRMFVVFYDDAGTLPNGDAQSFSKPLFAGHVWEIEPAESNRVDYTCYDPTMIAGREIPVMSTGWAVSAGAGLAPLPDPEAVPRLIFNNTIFNDVDYSFERAANRTIGQIIATVLDDAVYPLHWFNAAPSPVGTHPYTNSELDAFAYQPQAKVVSTNESIRALIDRLTQEHYPEYAFLWTPETSLWHWYSRLTSTAETITLNQETTLSSTHTTTVLSMELHRSLEGCYPAVEFRGPETAGPVEIFSTLDGSLAPIGPYQILENYIDSGGIGTVIQYGAYQIVDADKRRGSKLLPVQYLVRDDDYHWVYTKSPMFECTYDGGATWQAMESIPFDFQNGIATFPSDQDGNSLFVYFWSDHELEYGSTRHYWTPNGFRLIWAPYNAPITVRYPASGFEGTSYSVAGQQSVYVQYEELLAVGYNRFGIAVTTASRSLQYQLLAQNIHRARKDIKYTGGMLLDGLIYDFCRLNKCINIAAVDGDGNTVTTGWEAIAAIITDATYDFDAMTTQLTFSHAAWATWGENLDLLRERIRIGPVDVVRDISAQYEYSTFQSPYSRDSKPVRFVSGIVYTDRDLYYDPNLGTLETAL